MRILLALAFLLVGCSGPVELANLPPQDTRICCFGDSLVAGVGAGDAKRTYPAVLDGLLPGNAVLAFGSSGDTTADGLTKVAKFANQKFGIVVVTLGGNDILQRVHWDSTKANLHSLFQQLKTTGAVVVFTGVTGPLNPTRNSHYAKICEAEGVLLVPEILKGILSDPDLKADEVHPNAEGYRLVAERVAGALREAGLVTPRE
jgi:lysophospholipase L1-like esterase